MTPYQNPTLPTEALIQFQLAMTHLQSHLALLRGELADAERRQNITPTVPFTDDLETASRALGNSATALNEISRHRVRENQLDVGGADGVGPADDSGRCYFTACL